MSTDTTGTVIDTDAASGLYRHHHLGRPLDGKLAAVTGRHRLLVSAITLGEAYHGATKAKWSPNRIRRLLTFYQRSFPVLPVDTRVAYEYGRLRTMTEAVGRPVADNDLWIAATATAVNVPLMTLNRRHFEPLTLHGLRLL